MAEASLTQSSLRLAGKVAIVTGGANGIGKETAHVFAEQGARMVVIADIQDELGNQVAASIGCHRCTYIHCDIANEDQVKNLVQSTVNTYGQVDIMFSNARIASPSNQTILELDISQADKLLSVNVRGMALCVKHAARAMVEGCVRGSIVCTASVASSHGGMKLTDYTILGLMRSASVQLAKHGIRVNCVSPNGLATPSTCKLLDAGAEKGDLIFGEYKRSEGVVLNTKHVANVVLFLASNESDCVTNINLQLNGVGVLPDADASVELF